MTKEYLKMADVFPSEMRVGGDSDNLIIDDVGIIIGCYSGDKMAEHVLHAINSHDELVAEVERLRESNKRMADVIWSKAKDQCSQDKDIAMTQERFIEQYCCFPAPHQK